MQRGSVIIARTVSPRRSVMHEVSVIEEVIRTIRRQRDARGFSRLTRVELVCGRHSCVSEENLRFIFAAASRSSFMEGAVLDLTRLPARWRCRACGEDFEGEDVSSCPRCGAAPPTPLMDQRLFISHLEVQE